MLNLEAFCFDHRIEYLTGGHHHAHQGWAQIHCPFCSSGIEGYHLGFSLERGSFNCWRCGKHSVWDTLGRLLNTNDKQLIGQVFSKYDKAQARVRDTKKKQRKRSAKKPAGMDALTSHHKRYLRGRGFSPKLLTEKWGVQGTEHLGGQWRWRLIYPIQNQEGDIVGYQGRTIRRKCKPKYKMSDDADMTEDATTLLYGHHKATGDTILVTEGVTDVWNFGYGTVATMGIDWTLEQANKIRQYKNRFIMFDPEEQAQKRAEELAKWLSYFPGNTEIIEDLPCDPGDLDEDEVNEIKALLS